MNSIKAFDDCAENKVQGKLKRRKTRREFLKKNLSVVTIEPVEDYVVTDELGIDKKPLHITSRTMNTLSSMYNDNVPDENTNSLFTLAKSFNHTTATRDYTFDTIDSPNMKLSLGDDFYKRNITSMIENEINDEVQQSPPGKSMYNEEREHTAERTYKLHINNWIN